jgi:hypothetical protein
MTAELRDRFSGSTIEERLEQVSNQLEDDGVGLWHIVSFGRDQFGLSGDALVEYVRRHLWALLRKGAKPVMMAKRPYYWKLKHYGMTDQETIDGLIQEWLCSGHDPDAGDVWLALPHIYEKRRPEQ